MSTSRIPAVFYRGGTSKAVFFKSCDLPDSTALRNRIFCHVMGSPDPYGRQLNGMGGGLSSLSKIVIVDPSSRDDADVDYTFVQIAVGEEVADYSATCGNMSSAVGPFAVAERMVDVSGDTASVRVYNTNTDKHYTAIFPIHREQVVEAGDFEIPGVAGTGAKVTLNYESPAGATTGHVLPSGNALDTLEVEGVGSFDVSLVDSANPAVFVRAADLNLTATETPVELDADSGLMKTLDLIRRHGAVAMGLSESVESAPLANPRVALVAAPQDFTALDGRRYRADQYQVSVRMVSMGNFHRAVPLTGAMCIATAANISGSIVHSCATQGDTVIVGNPSGLLPVEADVVPGPNGIEVVSATTYRTQRRLMEGFILYPAEFDVALA